MLMRFASTADAQGLSAMLADYVREAFSSDWGGSEAKLFAGLASGQVRVLLATQADLLVGFAALVPDYDLHHCVRGVRVIDLYVVPPQRGRCIGPALLAHVAQLALSENLSYVRGEAVPNPTVRRLFARVAAQFDESFNLSGQALRELADLCAVSPRELVRRLPSRERNYEL